MQETRHVSVSTAAQILNESPSTTLRRVQSGSLPAEKLGDGTRSWVIKMADVEALRDQLVAERKAKVEKLRGQLERAESSVPVSA